MAKPVVLIAEELSPATLEALGPDFEVRNCNGADRAELLAALSKGVDAVLIRSATKMDAEAIAAAKGLKVIARAGVGLDNVEIPAATAAGVMVVNAPTSNIVSAAELAIGLLLASARFISPAHTALQNGKWARSKYTGAEVFEKTLGVVGFGRNIIATWPASHIWVFIQAKSVSHPQVFSGVKSHDDSSMVSCTMEKLGVCIINTWILVVSIFVICVPVLNVRPCC